MNIPILNDSDRKIITENIDLVFGVWRDLKNNWIKFSFKDDLVEAGYEGLCRAAAKWDEALNYKFSSLAYPYIQSAMYHELKRIRRRSTRDINIDKVVHTDDDGRDMLLSEFIEDPTDFMLERIENLSLISLYKVLCDHLNRKEFLILQDYADGLTYAQIGEKRGISRQRIGQYMNQIRAKLIPICTKYFKI